MEGGIKSEACAGAPRCWPCGAAESTDLTDVRAPAARARAVCFNKDSGSEAGTLRSSSAGTLTRILVLLTAVDDTFLGSLGQYYKIDDFASMAAQVETIATGFCTDARVTKVVSATNQTVGGSFTFTVTITNTGKFAIAPTAARPMVFADTLPLGLTFQAGSVAPGGAGSPSATCSYDSVARSLRCSVTSGTLAVSGTASTWSYTYTAAATGPGTFSVPTVLSPFLDNTAGNNNAAVQVTVTGVANTNTPVSDPTVSASLSASTVLIGSKLNATVTVTNQSPSVQAINVVTEYTLPAGLDFDNSTSPPAGCSVSGKVLTCAAGNMSASGSTAYVVGLVAVLGDTWDSEAIVDADNDGDATNNGPVVATVTVLATCDVYNPDGTRFGCSAGSIFNTTAGSDPVPDQDTCCITCQVCADFVDQCGSFNNLCGATINCTCSAPKPFCHMPQTPLQPAGPGFCSNSSFNPSPDLDVAITRTVPAAPVLINTTFDTNLTVRVVSGQSGANDVVVVDTLPPGLALVSVQTPVGTCTPAGSTITCAIGAMALSQSVVMSVRVRATAQGTQSTNTTVSATGDTNATTSVDSQTITVICASCASFATAVCGNISNGCGGTMNCTCSAPKPFCHMPQTPLQPAGPGFCSNSSFNPSPDLDVAITRTVPAAPLLINTTFDMPITVRVVSGQSGADDVVVVDTLPPGLALVSVQTPVGTCTPAGSTITCAIGAMALSQSVVMSVRVRATAQGTQSTNTTVSATGDTNATTSVDSQTITVICASCASFATAVCGNISNGCGGTVACTCPADRPVCSQPSPLQPGSCSSPVPVPPSVGNPAVSVRQRAVYADPALGYARTGEAFDLVLTVQPENGPAGAQDVVLQTTLPAGLELISVNPRARASRRAARPRGCCALAALIELTAPACWPAAGGGCAITYPLVKCTYASLSGSRDISISVKANSPGAFMTVAEVTASGGLTNRDSNTLVVVKRDAGVSIAVTTPSGSVLIGSKLNCTLVVTNPGTLPATGVVAKYTLPPGLAFDPSTPLPAGCTIGGRRAARQPRSPRAAQAGGTLSCGPGSVPPGGNVAYVVGVVAIQEGSWDSTARVAATNDTNPSNDGPVKLSITVRKTCAMYSADGAPFNCTAGTELDATQTSNASPSQATCCEVADGAPDVSIAVTTPSGSVLIGSKLNCTLVVTNPGTLPATGVVAKYTLPPGLAFDPSTPLPAGCTIGGRRAARQPRSPRAAQAGGTLSCGPGSVPPGGNVAYVVGVVAIQEGSWDSTARVAATNDTNPSNDGPVKLSITVRKTCAMYSADGAPFNCTAGTALNATQTSNASPSQATCCEAAVMPEDTSGPDVSITASTLNTAVLIGSKLNCTLVVTNPGALPATGVVANYTLPPGLAFDPSTPLPAGCTIGGRRAARQPRSPRAAQAGGTLSCGPGSVPPGGNVAYVVGVVAVQEGSWDSTARVAATNDTNPSNDGPVKLSITVRRTCVQYSADGAPFNCTAGTALNATQTSNASPSQATCCEAAVMPEDTSGPDVSITASTLNTAVLIGSKLNCTLVVTNPGALPATGVVAKYTLPPGLAFDPSTPLPAGCTVAVRSAAGSPRAAQAGGTLSCGPGSVPPGGNVAYVVGVVAVQEGSWDSTARVTATNDTNPSNDGPVKLSITVAFAPEVTGAPDVSIAVTTPSGSVLIGSKLNCTLVVANPGALPATGVVANYTLPPGLAFDPSTPLPAGCTVAVRSAAGSPRVAQAGGTLSCGPGSVPPGGNVAYVVGVVAVQEGSWDSTARVTATNDTNPSNDGPVKLSITVRRTCGQYSANGTRFGCSTGSSFNTTAANDPTPGQQTCCIDCKGCADFASGCGTISDGCGGTLDCGCSGATPFCHQSQALQALSELGYCDAAPFNPGSSLDVLVDKVGPSEPVELGSEFNFLVTVRVVSGPKGANDVTVVDTLPPGLELVSLRTPRGTCTPSGSTITCAFGNMVLSQSVVVMMRVRATAKGMHNTSIATKASDDNLLNNKAMAAVQVICSTCDSFLGRCGAIATGCGTIQCGCPKKRPVCVQLPGATSSSVCNTRSVSPGGRVDVAVMVTGPTSAVVVGREFELLITATVLSGAKGARNVVVTSRIPDGLEVVGVVPDAQCTIQYPSISCAVGSLGMGESFSLRVHVKATRAGSFSSSATVSATADAQKANNRYDRGQCSVMARASCASGAAWSQGANCTLDVCPQAGLTTRWYACTLLGEACHGEGQACGSCPGGASCCDGLTCKWDHKHGGNGVCTKPFTCAQDGASCAAAEDCCPGSTCSSDGRCRPCDCDRRCHKHDKACEAERESECKSLSAVVASAVLPGPGGAIIQVRGA
ncbi:hypothetical protein HT031_005627 [Scenedesmus sp. PABB004]|nr:hypothetical protein HT031_005627 [Scenedesmus sp. PABB004]